jgi:hypothetical protein
MVFCTGIGCVGRCSLELLTERLLVEEDPRISVPPVPMILELPDTLQNAVELFIADEADEGCSGPGGV